MGLFLDHSISVSSSGYATLEILGNDVISSSGYATLGILGYDVQVMRAGGIVVLKHFFDSLGRSM